MTKADSSEWSMQIILSPTPSLPPILNKLEYGGLVELHWKYTYTMELKWKLHA